MTRFATLLALACCIVGSAAAAPGVPTHRAELSSRNANRGACMDNRPIFRAAYAPDAITQAPRCGHLLSTDTLVTVHKWDRT